MPEAVLEIECGAEEETAAAVYEHPWVVRFTHWVNAVALFVMVGSGLQIFRAFPSFGAKIPQQDLLHWPKGIAIGGWLGGGLQWHMTFLWIYIASGLFMSCTRYLAGTTSRSCSGRRIYLAFGLWCGTTSSSASSRRREKHITRCRSWRTPQP